MRTLLLLTLTFIASLCCGVAQEPIGEKPAESAGNSAMAADFDLSRACYTPQDSARVVALLAEKAGPNDVLHYARKFLGVPYVAHTLEVADPELLVVNLRQLDCTTLVETVCALALTHREGGRTFADFCRRLERLRYRDGRMDGYCSRLHYFAWWMADNAAKGLVTEVTGRLWTAPMAVNNYYMSQHWESYKMLKAHPAWVSNIRRLEQATNGERGNYLPEADTALPPSSLGIRDGDIIAIVTTKQGLDYSHLGFAAWGLDGKLHLLNASSLHKKVVEEPKTLRQYLSEHPTSVGIRVLRLQ